jgi:tetratricopeptide (TPR) repeat protein
MKRDEILETASRFFGYITDHTKGLLILLAGFVGLVLVGVGVYAYSQSRVERANELFAQALAVYQADIKESDSDPDDPHHPTFATVDGRDLRAQELFQQVEADYGGASVGRIAKVYLGKLALRRGDSERARELWESFVSTEEGHMLATEVRLNLLALDRSEGMGEEVVTRLQELIGSSSPEFPIEVALDQLAGSLEDLGRYEEARDIYQRIVDEHPSSPYSSRAQQKLNSL